MALFLFSLYRWWPNIYLFYFPQFISIFILPFLIISFIWFLAFSCNYASFTSTWYLPSRSLKNLSRQLPTYGTVVLLHQGCIGGAFTPGIISLTLNTLPLSEWHSLDVLLSILATYLYSPSSPSSFKYVNFCDSAFSVNS